MLGKLLPLACGILSTFLLYAVLFARRERQRSEQQAVGRRGNPSSFRCWTHPDQRVCTLGTVQVRIHATWHRKRNAKVSPRSFRTDTAGVHCSWHSSVIGKRISVLGPCRTNTISSGQKTFATTPGKRRERRSSGYCGSSESLNTMPWQV